MRGKARPAGCAGASLLVSAEPERGECPHGVGLLDRFTVWRSGAQAVWIGDGGLRVVSDRGYRGTRPWVAPVPTPHRVIPNLPMATSETLPADAPR